MTEASLSPLIERLPRREFDVNSMHDVSAFVERWDNSVGMPTGAFQLWTSPYGNVGDRAEPGTYAAPDLCPQDEQWLSAVEPAVLPLVDAVVERWLAITYTSCQGHLYPDLALPSVPLEVGLLPRDEVDLERLSAFVEGLVPDPSLATPLTPCIALRIWSNELLSEATGRTYPVVDLVLERVEGNSWEDYFVERATAVAALLSSIESSSPSETHEPPPVSDHEAWEVRVRR